jgi:uncharacterized repeat protein (TIGR03806 family)
MKTGTLFLLLLSLASCFNRDPPPPFSTTWRVLNSTCKLEGSPDASQAFDVERAFPNVSFMLPTQLLSPPDATGRIFVVEQRGVVSVFPNRADVTEADHKTFLRIDDRVLSGGERGLLSIAFHPRYAQNRLFYAYYTRAPDGAIVVARYQASAANPDLADPSTESVVLSFAHPDYADGNGGQLLFGPDGKLYIFTGDGGGDGDPQSRAQNLGLYFGKVLRIDVDGAAEDAAYAIPPDNPFVGTPGALPEIWAYGLRNPWRCSFDPAGKLWCSDVGRSRSEEIDVIERGANYGWPRMEGFACASPPTGCNDGSLTLPLFAYGHDQGCAIVGGFVYRGSELPELRGAYIYGDYCSGRIWALRDDGAQASNMEIAHPSFSISSFGEDAAGELYIVSYSSQLQRLKRPTPQPGAFPATASATGCYSNAATQEVAPGLVPYEVNSPLWADGTEKRRFIALPGTGRIGYTPQGAWSFPEGTLLMKEFWLELERGNPRSRRLLETRLLRRRSDAWEGFSYQWNDDQSDAVLLAISASKDYTVRDPVTGTTSTHTHYFPSRSDCARCHTSAAGGALGLQTAQLNRDHDYGAMVENQLTVMDRIGLFTSPLPGTPETLARLPDPLDPAEPVDVRARSYLHGNCSHCHLPGGTAPTTIDFRFFTPFRETNTCNAIPTQGDLDIDGARIVKPGSPDESVLWLRMSRRGANQMPPLATSIVDSAASAVLRSWIQSLDGCP